MLPLRSFPLRVLASSLLWATAAMCQQYAPAVRIVNAVDESQLTTLKGNTHPAANASNDRGAVSQNFSMSDLILVLSRSPEQQAAFDKFVASQYDPNSSDFHQWLTPEQVGQNFGPSETDIATISNWLTGHGFTIDEVGKDRMTIRFSGNAGQVQSTFHTEIHNLVVNGVPHIANMSDPQIPAALLPAVVGVKSLHNFFAKPLHTLGSLVTRDGQTGGWKRGTNQDATTVQMKGSRATGSIRPQFGINDPTYGLEEDVTPYDFATIYNVAPLWSGTTSAGVIDGTGQTIAIAGTSSVNLPDISAFRNAFGPLPANTPQLVSGNSSPLTVCTDTTGKLPYPSNPCELDDLLENSLDVEWSGAVAKNAQIVLVSSYPTSATDDGLFDSESYIINNLYKTAKIMSVSYGECELGMGTAGNAEYNTLWQTAYTEGIAVFVAAGDQGSASCDAGFDSSTPYRAEYGLSVSGFASTPYNTAVGGTDLNWGSTTSPYWGASNNSNGSNALGYIPEVPWNDTCTNPIAVAALNSDIGASLTATQMCDEIYTENVYSTSRSGEAALLSLIDIVGGSGGMSSCTTSDGSHVSSCSGGYSKPIWQAGVTGIPNDGVRDIPDVSFFASNGFLGSAYLICVSEAGSACTYSATSENTAQEVGGTSVSSPAMAGVMALINQKAGTPQGSPNTELYALAAQQSYGSCSAERGGGSPVTSSSCYFNDIDTGTIAMPCDYSDKSPNCVGTNEVGILSGYGASAGYDLATGLGSLNVANVVNHWTATTLSPAFVIFGASLTIAAGATTGNTSTINLTPLNGFTGSVNLSCAVTSTPGGANPVTCGIPSPVSITGTSAVNTTLTINSTANTTGGAYVITVTGTSGGLTETALVNVSVTSTVNVAFTLSVTTQPPAIASPGGSAAAIITVAPVNGYTGTVTFSCLQTGGPGNAAGDAPVCLYSSSPVTVGGTETFTIETSAKVAELAYPKPAGKGSGWAGAGGGAILAFLVFLGIPARRRSWRSMLGILVLLVALGGLSSCGGGGGGTTSTGDPGTSVGTYTFQITGTGVPAVTPAPFTSFSVTVN